jgi:nitrate reductase delta subunit
MPLEFTTHASRLFSYPSQHFALELAEFERYLARCPAALAELSHFVSLVRGLSLKQVQELYTRTFDLTPICAPYLSVHLFGDSSFKRAQLMTGLREAYVSCCLRFDDELPDHLAIVLSALDHLDAAIQHDLIVLCLQTALPKMQTELERQRNPYAHAVASLRICVDTWKSHKEVLCA